MLISCQQLSSRIGPMTKTLWISLFHLAVNDKMVRELMSNLLVLLVCCLLSPFYISHHNVGNGELPIFVILLQPIYCSMA
jgi:hypothetical protein